ncbi:nucleotidyl transferase AbiEii/AbiGii toxin family protein [Candidatus Roizmanbacteria bacterium]|nr:nucleotidyl transferase AbiEii/AbiGii toxin family protein [Candidatus Roizmanbacteria bacterium]
MNILIDNFAQILSLAKEYGLPVFKKRAILREYLQTKVLEFISQQKESSSFIFVGGTSLRLLRGMDRFSEDLDFDLDVRISFETVDELLAKIVNRFVKENIAAELYRNKKTDKTYYELRFPKLLSTLKLSSSRDEKLMIKLDFEKFWRGHKKEIVFVKRYGFLANIVSANLDNILIEKLTAYLRRKETQPRDLYDIIWLVSYGAKFDNRFAQKNKISRQLLEQVIKKYEREKNRLAIYKRRLRPFLFKEENVEKLNFFPNVVNDLKAR